MDQLTFLSALAVDLSQVPAFVEWQLDAPDGTYPSAPPVSEQDGHRFVDELGRAGTLVLELRVSRAPPGLANLVTHATQLGMTTWLAHGGEPQCDAALLSKLHAAGLTEMAVRLDGPDAVSHDARRGKSGSFAAARHALDDATRAGIKTRACTRVYPGLIGELERVLQTAADLGCARHQFVFPTASDGWLPTPREVEALLQRLAALESAAPTALVTSAAPHFERVRRALRRRTGSRGKGSSTVLLSDGRGTLFASSDGRICPSAALRVPCGALETHEVVETYRYHPLFRTLRDAGALRGRCGRCEFATACGGSRARAYSLCGRLLASDPLCAYEPPEKPGLSFP